MKQESRIQTAESKIDKAHKKYLAVLKKEIAQEGKRTVRELNKRFPRHKFSLIIKYGYVNFHVDPPVCGQTDIREIPPPYWRGAIEEMRQIADRFHTFAFFRRETYSIDLKVG